MTGPIRQQGGLLIVTVVLIVTIGFLAAAMPFIFVSETRAMLDQARSEEAFVIAESGLQRGIRQWKLAPTTYASEGPVAFGGGNFTITVAATDFAGAALPSGQKRIVSVGLVPSVQGNVSRTTEAIVALNGATLSDPFPSAADWAANWVTSYDPAKGTLTHDVTTSAPPSAGGSVWIVSNPAVDEQIFSGTAIRTLSSSVASGTSVTLNFWFRMKKGHPSPDEMKTSISLTNASGSVVCTLWSHDGVTNMFNPWTEVTATKTCSGATFTKLRIWFQLKNGNGPGAKKETELQFDEITLSGGGSGSSAVTQWREPVF